jgi:hypothetical protein
MIPCAAAIRIRKAHLVGESHLERLLKVADKQLAVNVDDDNARQLES